MLHEDWLILVRNMKIKDVMNSAYIMACFVLVHFSMCNSLILRRMHLFLFLTYSSSL